VYWQKPVSGILRNTVPGGASGTPTHTGVELREELVRSDAGSGTGIGKAQVAAINPILTQKGASFRAKCLQDFFDSELLKCSVAHSCTPLIYQDYLRRDGFIADCAFIISYNMHNFKSFDLYILHKLQQITSAEKAE
jgi:hypothetical protein